MIQETKTSVVYVGDGRQRSFPFPYRYYDAKHVVGYVERNGKWERITGNYEYHDTEKSYEYPTTGEPLASGVRLKLVRETARSQEYDFGDDHIEKAFDKITMMMQEINRDGLVQVGVGGFDGVIPAGRPFAFLQYNADASGFDVVDLPDFAGEQKILLSIRDDTAAAARQAERAAKTAGEQVFAGTEALRKAQTKIERAAAGGVARIEGEAQRALADVAQAAIDAESKTKGAVQSVEAAAEQAKKEMAVLESRVDKAKEDIHAVQADVRNDLTQKQGEFDSRAKEVLDTVGGLEATVQRGEDAVDALRKYDGLEDAVKQAKAAYDQLVVRLEKSLADATNKAEEMAQIETAAKTDAQAATDARKGAEAAAGKANSAATSAGKSATAASRAQAVAQQARTGAETASAAAKQANTTAQAAQAATEVAAKQAGGARDAAAASAAQAKRSEDAAAASAVDAKAAADKAQQIAGGDFLTRSEAKVQLASKANTADVYTKTQADGRYLQKTDKIDAYTKAETDGTFATKTEVGAKADTGVSYTKAESDGRYIGKIDAYTKSETDDKFQPKGNYVTTRNMRIDGGAHLVVWENVIFDAPFRVAPINEKQSRIDVDNAIYGIKFGQPLLDYAKTDEVEDFINQKVTGLASVEYVDGRVANIVNSAPETLDTLQELAQALGNDPNFATTVSNQIGTKADKATMENALQGKADIDRVYTKIQMISKLGDKVDKGSVYNKLESDRRYLQKDDKVDAYTKREADERFMAKSDEIDAYTKREADGKFARVRGNDIVLPNGARIGVERRFGCRFWSRRFV